jgi:hydrogenase maturation protease
VIGVGNPYRGDDRVGLDVVRALRGRLPAGADVRECEGEPAGLIDVMAGAGAVWLVDAVKSGDPPGTVHRVQADAEELPTRIFGTSTHALGLADAVELARALGRLPAHTVVFGISGAAFGAGEGLAPGVAAAVGPVAEAIRAEMDRFPAASADADRPQGF